MLRTTVRTVHLVLTVTLADAKTHRPVEAITATREHPFYVRGRGFVPAGGLAVGNAIVTRAGPPLVVASVRWQRRAEGYRVYNFVVEDEHTYFVGKAGGGAWVHNPLECGQFGAILTESEAARFSELSAEHPNWMPDIEADANVLTKEETAAARSEWDRSPGHHRHPLAFGGEPNPSEGLVETNERAGFKNPIHTRVTNFWNDVLRRIRREHNLR